MKMNLKISRGQKSLGLILLSIFLTVTWLTAASFAKDCGPAPCPGTSPAIWPERTAPLGNTIRILGWNLNPSTSYQMVVIQPDGLEFSIDSVTTNQKGDFLIDPQPYLYPVPEMQGTYEVRIYHSAWSGDLDQWPIASTTFYNW